ncbi:MAG: carboxypeptidase regulatory-like domain-containing protein [Planctomycetes bacterium]|nr:carboxypeptidase regulatory-like domain-containing protein [Planctomycetota bacterium]
MRPFAFSFLCVSLAVVTTLIAIVIQALTANDISTEGPSRIVRRSEPAEIDPVTTREPSFDLTEPRIQDDSTWPRIALVGRVVHSESTLRQRELVGHFDPADYGRFPQVAELARGDAWVTWCDETGPIATTRWQPDGRFALELPRGYPRQSVEGALYAHAGDEWAALQHVSLAAWQHGEIDRGVIPLETGRFVNVWPERRVRSEALTPWKREPITNAQVVLLHEDRVQVGRVATDAEGRARFGPLPPGDYVALAHAAGERGWGPVPLRDWRSHQTIVLMKKAKDQSFHIGPVLWSEIVMLDHLEVRVDTPIEQAIAMVWGRHDPFARLERLADDVLLIRDLDPFRTSALFLRTPNWYFPQANHRGVLPLPPPASFGVPRVKPTVFQSWPLPNGADESWRHGSELRLVEDPSGSLETRGMVSGRCIAFRSRSDQFPGGAVAVTANWHYVRLGRPGQMVQFLTRTEVRTIVARQR